MHLFRGKKLLTLSFALSAFFAIANGTQTYAESTGQFDYDGVTWEYKVENRAFKAYDMETKKYVDKSVMELSIGFKSAASDKTIVKIPPLATVKANVNDTDADDLDTYFVTNLVDAVDATIPDSIAKIDMTDMTDGQVRSVSPMLDNTSTEIELVFGDDMQITDNSTQTCRTYGTTVNCTTSYGVGAFEGRAVKLVDFNKLKYVGWNAFKNAVLNADSTSITFANGSTMGGHVFENTNVTSLTINSPYVGEAVCSGCSELTNLTLGNNTSTVFGDAFMNTPKLSQAVDLSNVTTLFGRVFENSAITNVTFGDHIDEIQYQAFKNTQSLDKDIDFKSVKNIGYHAFDGSAITGISFSGKAIQNIGDSAFANTNIGELDFTDINPTLTIRAFYNANLTSVNLASLTMIGDLAFEKNSVKTVYLPKTLTSRGVGIFKNNPVETITVAYDTNINSLYRKPFALEMNGCASFGGDYNEACTIYPTETATTLNVVAPYGADEMPATDSLYNTPVGGLRNVIANEYFENLAGPKTITIGEGYEGVNALAFQSQCVIYGNCSTGFWRKVDGGAAPTSFTLPSTLKYIGESAFQYYFNDSSLVWQSMPESLEYVGVKAFMNDAHLTINTIDSPNLSYVGEFGFYTVKVSNLSFHDKLSGVGHAAFVGSKSLKNITFDVDIFGKNSNNYSILQSSFQDCFDGRNYVDLNTGYLPSDFVTTANKLDFETHYEKIIFTNKSVTSPNNYYPLAWINADLIDASAASWTNIQDYAFEAARIKELKLPSTIEQIGRQSFYGAKITEPLTLPSSLKTVGEQAFMTKYKEPYSDIYHAGNGITKNFGNAAEQEEVLSLGVNIQSLPESIETIAPEAFYMNPGVTADFNLPNLKTLGNSAFAGTNIHNVVLSDSLTTIGITPFFQTPNLHDITFDLDIFNMSGSYFSQSGTIYSTNLPYDMASFFDKFGVEGETHFGTITYTSKVSEPKVAMADRLAKDTMFFGITADKLDLSATNWEHTGPSAFQESNISEVLLPHNLTTIDADAFYQATINSITIPETVTILDEEAFQWATGTITNFLPNTVKQVKRSAFFGADMGDDLVIPADIETIGADAFNAGDADVTYNTVTINADLDYSKTTDQPIFVVFYANNIDKLIVNSADLPTLHANDNIPEFHAMTMSEVKITSLPAITANAFEECANLERVDAGEDDALRDIREEAFLHDVKLHIFNFSPNIKNETVTIGKRAFKGTAFASMGDGNTEFDLTAAKFDAGAGYAFSGMSKLKTVDIPSSFSGATVPEASFFNDAELEQVTIDYKTTKIQNAAFANDDELKRVIIWGDTTVYDENLPGYHVGTSNLAGDSADDEPTFGPTIPEGTNIYAYSTSSAEQYAGFTGRDSFEGEFYPLDEVIYLTSNKPRAKLDGNGDFDKTGVIVYGMRRDGIILESESWAEFDGTSYARSEKDLTFETMDSTIAERPDFGMIFDTPVPREELSFANENFANIGYQIKADEEGGDVIIELIYTDKYTQNQPDTYIDSTDDMPIIPILPVTWDQLFRYIGLLGIFAVIAVVASRYARKSFRA